ncbi:hypothetical protein IWQ62_000645 [Dispira parvispora]|uniref:Damage-control phosphatase ARMT1-like metal-binding domain-containing protein n=1 Tax=Dispira parvispora TaxID=1520584 RepID=A0A9W8B079_9FUNG|nr:hypothetical protein IWQ62_000645 [Dispira parvispora]
MDLHHNRATTSTDPWDEPHASPNGTQHIALPLHTKSGSLTKVVYFSHHPTSPAGRLNFTWFETDQIEACIDFIGQLLKDWDNLSSPCASTPPSSQVNIGKEAQAESSPTTSPTPTDNINVTTSLADSLRNQATITNDDWKSSGSSQPLPTARHVLKATGGGAHKYHSLFVEKLGVILQKEDEMDCLVTGLNFFITKIPDEVFTYSHEVPMCFQKTPLNLFPYILVNIGSGVSILKVTGNDEYERISGTSLGGGTLWGLLTLLTKARTFDEMLELSKTGDNHKVDMLVGDIYGTDYNKIGLKGSTIASSMGKVFRKKLTQNTDKFSDGDISRSLLYMVSNNIGQIAYLNAKLHNIQRIYFGGSFIQGHPDTMHTLSYAIKFWSKGTIKALFLRHEGYLGAMGAYLKRRDRKSRSGSFYENFTISRTITDHSLSAYGTLDQALLSLKTFPLLANPEKYEADTLDLTQPQAYEYWIDLLGRRQPHMKQLALEWAISQGDSDAEAKANQFDTMYRQHLGRLRQQPMAYGPITVRHLLALREQCLQEVGFRDIFAPIKEQETAAALQSLPHVLAEIDKLPDEESRLDALISNILAGNMFDWGSNAIVEMMEKGILDFDSAKGKVQSHPLYDNRKAFIRKLLTHSPAQPCYHRAVIFSDNSGADIYLGIIPFALHLLRLNIEVIIACNSFPAVNDITDYELHESLSTLGSLVPDLARFIRKGRLQVFGNGNATPCLDLSRLNEDLVEVCQKVDLVILEGMGRAIHTNFRARFTCDSLKLAVFKNDVTAQTLGAEMYDGICVYEQGTIE